MNAARERALLLVGALVVLAGVAANELVLARLLSPDGTLAASTLLAIRVCQGVLCASGLVLCGARRRLAPWLAAHAPFREGAQALGTILAVGLVLRVVVFLYLAPQNNDPHWEFVRFIVENRRLPVADELILGFQPPLYYLLAAPFAIGASLKATQVLSLLLSLANLVLLHRFAARTRLLGSHAARCHALLLAAILPQFVLFSGFVSNDALAFPLGTLTLLQVFRYVDTPSRKNLVLLAVVQGLALLTKGTLIGNLPVLGLVVVAVELGKRAGTGPALANAALFGVLTAVVGGYKFVENTVHFGTPVVGNDVLEQEWVQLQEGTVQGLSSYVDVDVTKLVRQPFVHEDTLHSIPLLLYATFWTSYIDESNLEAVRRHPWKTVPRLLYLAGIVPTLLLLIGVGSCLWRQRTLPQRLAEPSDDAPEGLKELAAVLSLLLAAGLVLKWGVKHDAWSFFQSRLFFTSFLALALAQGRGYERAERRGPLVTWPLNAALGACYLLIGAYFAVELGAQALG
jgi:hypothetical protein